jgi:hypothetical protein
MHARMGREREREMRRRREMHGLTEASMAYD